MSGCSGLVDVGWTQISAGGPFLCGASSLWLVKPFVNVAKHAHASVLILSAMDAARPVSIGLRRRIVAEVVGGSGRHTSAHIHTPDLAAVSKSAALASGTAAPFWRGDCTEVKLASAWVLAYQ